MKIRLTEMITRPEPSASPVSALYMALLVSACLTSAIAVLFAGI
ncbi:MAG: hypothetical protein JWR80_7973 [Bradyrhizobium sp.]|nr:hypothetical protein [Bradyrhizobium sp.]